MRVCKQCEEEKHHNAFYKNRHTCKACIADNNRKENRYVKDEAINKLLSGWQRAQPL